MIGSNTYYYLAKIMADPVYCSPRSLGTGRMYILSGILKLNLCRYADNTVLFSCVFINHVLFP